MLLIIVLLNQSWIVRYLLIKIYVLINEQTIYTLLTSPYNEITWVLLEDILLFHLIWELKKQDLILILSLYLNFEDLELFIWLRKIDGLKAFWISSVRFHWFSNQLAIGNSSNTVLFDIYMITDITCASSISREDESANLLNEPIISFKCFINGKSFHTYQINQHFLIQKKNLFTLFAFCDNYCYLKFSKNIFILELELMLFIRLFFCICWIHWIIWIFEFPF